MAEENQAGPITEAQPPKADPTAKPVAAGVKTLKLNPVVRKPVAGATQSALRPTLKLPPKPGLPAGLKLPPKTGATVSALRPGLKLPSQAGATASALRPGLKLPPKPVIRKPGEASAAAPLPKPVAVDAQGVGKLPTVDAKAVPRDDTAPQPTEAPKPIESLKKVTQKLKGITQQIPAQAILHKTGIISDAAMSDAQKQAAKSKTSRISLSDAMGVAPVKSENAPMKTIRIKRPIDIPGATKSLTPQPPAETASASAPVPAAVDAAVPPMPSGDCVTKTAEHAPVIAQDAPAEASTGAAPSPTITQRKTLKISRPGASGVRPSGKFAVKRPGAKTAAAPANTGAADKPAAANADGAVADIADIPDIPDIPSTPVSSAPAAADVSDVPAWASALGVIVEIAASVAVAALAWFLYQDFQLPLYCGGCM